MAAGSDFSTRSMCFDWFRSIVQPCQACCGSNNGILWRESMKAEAPCREEWRSLPENLTQVSISQTCGHARANFSGLWMSEEEKQGRTSTAHLSVCLSLSFGKLLLPFTTLKHLEQQTFWFQLQCEKNVVCLHIAFRFCQCDSPPCHVTWVGAPH